MKKLALMKNEGDLWIWGIVIDASPKVILRAIPAQRLLLTVSEKFIRLSYWAFE